MLRATHISPRAHVTRSSFPFCPTFQVGECVATWVRPHFEELLYPYTPPHVTRPKETKRIFVVHLPEKCYFAVRHAHMAAAVWPCARWCEEHGRAGRACADTLAPHAPRAVTGA
jgi:hypothetical protein